MKSATTRATSTPKQPVLQPAMQNYQTTSGIALCKLIQTYSHNQGSFKASDVLRGHRFNTTVPVGGMRVDDPQNPTTPQRQKMNVFSGYKASSHQNSDKRNSQSFNVYNGNPRTSLDHQTPARALQINFNNENDPRRSDLKRHHPDDIEQLIKENSSLQQTVLKFRSEAEHYRSLLGQSHRSEEDALNLGSLKSRIEKLEQVIDIQAKEIDEWKVKYQQAREQEEPIDEQRDLIAQLEGQIMVVIQENESLNSQVRDHVEMLNESQSQCASLEEKVKTLINENQRLSDVNESLAQQGPSVEIIQENELLKAKNRDLERNVKIQKEEIKTWHDTFQQFERDQEKFLQKENELFQMRIRIQELETQHLKRGHKNTDSDLTSYRVHELEQRVASLHSENQKLNESQAVSFESNKKNEKLRFLVEEVLSQQLFFEEELKRFRAQKQFNSDLVESLKQLIQHPRADMEPNDEVLLYEEFRRSQDVVQRLVAELQR